MVELYEWKLMHEIVNHLRLFKYTLIIITSIDQGKTATLTQS